MSCRISMIQPNELVVDKKAFSLLRDECEKIINTHKRLPDFVFQRPFTKYYAIEHSYVSRKEFGAFLFRVASVFLDESVNYMTVEPHPVDYYYRNCSFFGLASFNS